MIPNRDTGPIARRRFPLAGRAAGWLQSAPRTMKPWLSISLRVIVALLGLGYIAYSVQWHDEVVLPAGRSWGAWSAGERDLRLRVIGGSIGTGGAAGELRVIRTDPGADARDPLTIPAGTWDDASNPMRLELGVPTTLASGRRRWPMVALALGLIVAVYAAQSLRWWVLMRARRLEVSWPRTAMLFMVGAFFNYCMPGMTGGDVVKAWYAARRSDRRADAVMSVAFDRATGLVGLLLLACLAGLLAPDDPRVGAVTVYLWALLGGVIVVGAIYFTPRLRRGSGLDWLLARLPGRTIWKTIDAAAVAYRHHPGAVAAAVGISVAVHALLAVAAALSGWALGLGAPAGLLLTVVPVINMSGSIPISYQGLGVMEAVGLPLLVRPGVASANQVIGMLLLVRLCQIVVSLSGVVFLLRGDVSVQAARAAGDDRPERA